MPLVRGHYPVTNPDWLRAGQPSGLYRSSIPRWAAASNMTAQTSGVMLSVAVPLEAGDLVTSLTFMSGGTAGATLTHWWFALYSNDSTPKLLSQSADQTSTAWAANTAKTLDLGTPQLITESGIYYGSVMVAASTVPTLIGSTIQADASGGVLSDDLVLAQTSGSSLTGTAPSTITSATASGALALAIAS